MPVIRFRVGTTRTARGISPTRKPRQAAAADSQLHEVLRQRLKVARHANKRDHAMRLMTGFILKLEGADTNANRQKTSVSAS
ncbi:MAG: hypothetical protein ABI835_00840 [Chloroflexota bacterium]